jgi:hypothetical protein
MVRDMRGKAVCNAPPRTRQVNNSHNPMRLSSSKNRQFRVVDLIHRGCWVIKQPNNVVIQVSYLLAACISVILLT